MLRVSAPGLPADPGRTEIALAAGLAAAAGAVDVLAFTRMGQAFASIVTGNLVVAGTAIGQGDPRMLANVALAVAAFAVGVVLGGLGVRSAGLSSARWPVQVTVLCLVELVELVVLLVLTGVWLATGGAPLGAAQYVALVAAALAMGLQSAAFRLVPVPGVTTTYFTGTLTSLLVGLVTSGRLNVAALIALLALLAGTVLAGLLAAVAAVLLPVALLAVVVVVSTVRRRELWAASSR